MRILLFLWICAPLSLFAQFTHGFKHGAVTYEDLNLKAYAKDTTAVALVLDEFGESYIQNADPHDLQLEYHVRIKIFKKEGVSLANYEIPMRIIDSKRETVSKIEASTFNVENNRIVESKLETKNIFSEETNRYWSYKKFALPNVRQGSIIEIRYILTSPFFFNWRTWEFQSDVPKVSSEFWARIPANYTYNTVLRGPLKLSKSKAELEKNCFTIGSGNADCGFYQFAMNDIPAFKEEDYMTAKENFLATLNYELLEVKQFDGTTTKYTEEWKDVDKRLATESDFGDNIGQARKIWEDQIQLLVKKETDPLAKAKIIFDAVKGHYRWNEVFGYVSGLGAKKAYQAKKGNIGDINLSLVGALQAAGLQADPVLLSTRKNGTPIMLHPVITGFDYVIARLTIGDQSYWLDATNPLYAFGFVPEHCLNGKVRVMSNVSDWVDLKPKDKDKRIVEVALTIDKAGDLAGTIKITHHGYDAFNQRKEYASSSPQEYKNKLAKKWDNLEIVKYANQCVDSLEKPFVEYFEIKFQENLNSEMLYFSPFFVDAWTKNPFQSTERNYPVDFGAPLEQITTLTLDYKNLFTVEDLPKGNMNALPLSGGRYMFSVSNFNNTIQMSSNLTLNKSVYSITEYQYLKELFARIVQVQQAQFVLKKIK